MTGLVDLHIHTTASDGTLTPSELIEEIKDKSVCLFSVTDHDNIDNIEATIILANANQIAFIPGVEISVSYGTMELHILTYGIDYQDVLLKAIIDHNQAIRDRHNISLIKAACDKYSDIDFEDYNAYERNPKSGGWKAINFLLEKGAIKSMDDFFELVEEIGGPMQFESYDTVIPQLKELGYTLVLAHPTAYLKHERLSEAFLDELVELGIQGIECYSPYHKVISEQNYYLAYCEKKNLIITSGSDYHGEFIKSRHLAVPSTPIESIDYNRLNPLVLFNKSLPDSV